MWLASPCKPNRSLQKLSIPQNHQEKPNYSHIPELENPTLRVRRFSPLGCQVGAGLTFRFEPRFHSAQELELRAWGLALWGIWGAVKVWDDASVGFKI